MKQLLLSFIVTLCFLSATASALSIEMINHTSPCIYQQHINKDYCQTTYKMCDTFISSSDIDFKYRTPTMTKNEATEDMKGLIKYRTIKDELQPFIKCKIVTITALKDPYIDIDNIPCYGKDCFYEYAWWNSSFAYRTLINVNVSDGATLSDYVVLFNITYNATIHKPDFGDIRFLSNCSNGAEIPYWFMNNSIHTSENANIYARIPVINSTICIYSNNTLATNISNGSGTFDYFDDFNDNTDDLNQCFASGTDTLVTSNTKPYQGKYGLYLPHDAGSKEGGVYCIPNITQGLQDYQMSGYFYLQEADANSQALGFGYYINDTYRTILSGNIAPEVAFREIVAGGFNGLWASADDIENRWVRIKMKYNSTSFNSSFLEVNQATIVEPKGTFSTWKTNTMIGGNFSLYLYGNKNNVDPVYADNIYMHKYHYPEPITDFFALEPLPPAITPLNLSYVPPTPKNETVNVSYAYINVTGDIDIRECLLNWNGTNESMTNTTIRNFNINKTSLTFGNYTFDVHCNSTTNQYNNSVDRWVFINYTVPPVPPFNTTLNISVRYCINDDYLLVNEPLISGAFTEYLMYCQYGCQNDSIYNWGFAGCQESPILFAILLIVFIVALAVIIDKVR